MVADRLGVYTAKLAGAGLIGAFSLVGNSVEGCIATMLFSPIGMPISAVGKSMVDGRHGACAINVVIVSASVAILLLCGAAVRMWDTWAVAKPSNEEIDKRTAPFNLRNTVAYAMLIGALTALNDSPLRGPRAMNESALTLESVALAIAISISVPLINAGIKWVDCRNATSRADSDRHRRGMLLSLGMSACNVVGMTASITLAYWAAKRFHR